MRVVITGGAKGIGRGIAEGCVAAGWQVILADQNEQEVTATARELDCAAVVLDVTDFDQVQETYRSIAGAHGGIDAVVNSAGITRTGPSAEVDPADWHKVIAVNLNGTFHSCRAAVEHLKPGSSILNIASIAAVRALPQRAAYTASKFGIVGLTRVLAVEWAERNIRVNAIGPSWTDTPFLRELIDSGKLDEQSLIEKVPLKRLASVTDISGAARFLLSKDASFITGQTLYVDGGYTWAG